jgi:hypothetical protein
MVQDHRDKYNPDWMNAIIQRGVTGIPSRSDARHQLSFLATPYEVDWESPQINLVGVGSWKEPTGNMNPDWFRILRENPFESRLF